MRLTHCQEKMNTLLKQYLPPDNQTPLFNAMHYACLNGGKRLRPLLVYMIAELFDAAPEQLNPLAVAIELIHCYSLIHDDLPAMDNDDLRRGKPTCHKAFGEANAILAGDALLTLAFEVLANERSYPIKNQSTILKIIHLLAIAAGPQGMVYGQAFDMAAQGNSLNLEELMQMHRTKTGALISASVQCSALATGKASENDLVDLQKFGQALGLCFQIQDDILDAQGNSEKMGKNPGDAKKHKCTFVTLLGLKQAKAHALHWHQEAQTSLDRFKNKALPLRSLASFFIERSM
ncbi:MAG: polyprenyl synthetase family protein [Proteobacteria bacterium]|nr:polyprenyl synthetase family protein [Pseudomonadota bacterium]